MSIFLILSLISYSPTDPGWGNVRKGEIENLFDYPGAFIARSTLIVFGSYSSLISIFFFYSGLLFFLGIKNKLFFLKFISIIFSCIFLNIPLIAFSIELINPGLSSEFFFDVLIYYLPIINNGFFYKFIFGLFSLSLAIVLFLFSFSIKLKPLNNFFVNLYKIISFLLKIPFVIIKNLIKKNQIQKKVKFNIKNEPTINRTKRENKKIYKNKKNNNSSQKISEEFDFVLPDQEILNKSKTKNSYKKEIEQTNKTNSEKLEKVLGEYGVDGKVVGYKTGPIVTLFEFIPNAGIKASKVIGLSDDIARAMSSVSARISSQPGKTSLGIEIPNQTRESVMFGDLVEGPTFEKLNNSITLALGKDISGQKVYADLEKMPHLLIAGTTGSGKSVGINTIIMSILYRFKPDECKLILVDPKMLELSIYENIPHLLTPVVTNPNKAVFALKWVVREMENRYKLMSSLNVKNINSYNEKSKKILATGKKLFKNVQTGIDNETRQPIIEKREIPLEKMPFIVVVIDEMADLMMVAGKEVESLVQRLAQMARASGIHLVTATQRPSVDVITGTIKANFPSRLSYKVASKFDSRTILNEMGAEQLLGSGDMLFLENGASLKRLHGGYLSESEIEKVVNSIKEQSTFDEKNEISLDEHNKDSSMAFSFDKGEVDDLYNKAVDIVINQQKVSTSYIQRYLQIGYNRAARIVEKMEEEGIISEANNAGKRQVLKKN